MHLVKSDHIGATSELIDEDATPQSELDRFELQVIALAYVAGFLTPILFYGGWWLVLRAVQR